MNDFLLLLGAYAVTGTAVSAAVIRRNRTQSDYFIGNGAVGWVLSAMTYAATTYSAFMMVGLVGLSYAGGVGALYFELIYLVATVILLAVYGRRIWELARKNNLVSPTELFAHGYGRATATAGAILAGLALIPYTAVQVIGLSVILEGYGITYTSGVIFAVLVIATWTLLGGLRGVAITDAIQGVFMMILAAAALFWTGSRYGGMVLSTFPNRIWTPAFFVNLTLPWSFFALTNPQVLQRIFILKRREDLSRMIVLFAVFGLIYTVVVTVVGFSARYGTEAGLLPAIADQDRVIVAVMAQMGRALALPLALSIVFASVSTANSILLTLSSMFTRDVIRRGETSENGGSHRGGPVTMGRIVVLVLAVLVGLFALTRPDTLVELSVASSRILMVFLPLLFGLFYLRDNGPRAGLLTIIGGGVAALVLGYLFPTYSSVLTLAAVFLLFFAGRHLDHRARPTMGRDANVL